MTERKPNLTYNYIGSFKGETALEKYCNYNIYNAKKVLYDGDETARPDLRSIYGDSTYAPYSDTMFSPFHFFRLYFIYFHKNILDQEGNSFKVPESIVQEMASKEMINPSQAKAGKANKAKWSMLPLIYSLKVDNMLENFLANVYTLPNMTFVPPGFNAGRYAKTRDNFLIALNQIRKVYIERSGNNDKKEQQNILKAFLSGTKGHTQNEVVCNTLSWLASYDNFPHFVKAYHNESLLENSNDLNSRPVELWPGMFQGKLSPSKYELKSAIATISDILTEKRANMLHTS